MTDVDVFTHGGFPGYSHSAPVFEIDFDGEEEYPNGDKLPHLWITVPMVNDKGEVVGRTYTMHYPSSQYHLDPNDTHGDDALYYGGCYYDEAMGYTDPEDHQKRIECFQAAELLYRHAAGRGNQVANLCLGYVYSYDRCEGKYWVDPMILNAAEDYARPYPREQRAFECLSQAAQAGICEACYKLGDMYKHGIGCEPDAAAAFNWYMRASDLSLLESPVILGSVALRLAGCYEEGFGCELDFSSALKWYRRAAEALEVAVDGGEVWYEKALAGARAGAKRCAQEVAGDW